MADIKDYNKAAALYASASAPKKTWDVDKKAAKASDENYEKENEESSPLLSSISKRIQKVFK